MSTDIPAAFFSYSREDSEFPLRLAGDLKAAGANVWLDQLDIAPGQRWDRSVEDALTNCPRLLVILSPSSVDSTNVLDEVNFALENQKTVVPVIYRDCKIPFRLLRIQRLDFRTDYAHGLKELLKILGVEEPLGRSTPAPSAVAKESQPEVPDAKMDERDAKQKPLPRAKGATAVLDYSSAIKHVRNNGNEGSVVGHALATALEFQIAKATHQDRQMSARYIYYAARQVMGTTDTDSGAMIKDAIKVLAEKGAVEESVWPYVAGQYAAKPPAAVKGAKRFRIINAKRAKGLDALKRGLIRNGPVVAGIPVYSSAMTRATAKTGVIRLPKPKERIIGGHAIVIVGYDDKQKRLKFLNSWGADWGEHGFGYLPYEYVEKYLGDAWTFDAATT